MNNAEDIKNSIDYAKTKLKHYKDSIEQLEKELEELVWQGTEDEIVLSNLIVSANYPSWAEAKNVYYQNKTERLVYLEIDDRPNSEELNLNQMIQLRDYLTHKINYITG